MPQQCFSTMDSTPPICAVHQVSVVKKEIPIDSNAPGLGSVTCIFCPIGRTVVREMKGPYARMAS